MAGGIPFMRLQDLPSAAARFCLSVERFCCKDLTLDLVNTSVLIAYSGGADSKSLLLALYYLAPRLGLTLHVAILDHRLRPESASEIVEAKLLCDRLGIAFHTEARDVSAYAVKNRMGLEEAGRLQRLEFLETLRLSINCRWIAVGHQLNDLAEDCLMRMIRGTGWPALAGMLGMVQERAIIRPLLLTPRSEIELFLQALGESWQVDATNADDTYFRNRVRHKIMPLFLKENPSFLDTVADRWRMARRDAVFYRESLSTVAEKKKGNGVFLARAVLADMPESLRTRKYIDILARFGPGQSTFTHLTALDAAWQRNEGGKIIQFSGNKCAVIQNGGILFLPEKASL